MEIPSIGTNNLQNEFVEPTIPDEVPAPESETTPSEGEDEVTTLTDEERNLFSSLLTIGKIDKTFDVMGHEVVLRSMTVNDELLVGLETKKYSNTEAFPRAYQSAVIAASLVSMDGRPWYTPLSPGESESYIFNKRLEKVHKLYPIVLSEIYKHYIDTEKEFVGLAKKLGKL